MKKKIIVILAAVLAVVLIAAGNMYFNPTPARLIGRMAGNLDKVSSVEAEVSVEYEGSVNISVLGMPIVAPFALSTDLDVEAVTQPAVSHIEGTVSGSVYGVSMDTPLECYAQEEDGASTVYMSADHVHWLKHKAKDTDQEDPSFELDSKAVLGLMHKIASGEIETTLAGDDLRQGSLQDQYRYQRRHTAADPGDHLFKREPGEYSGRPGPQRCGHRVRALYL